MRYLSTAFGHTAAERLANSPSPLLGTRGKIAATSPR
jgi:hypothetical protein